MGERADPRVTEAMGERAGPRVTQRMGDRADPRVTQRMGERADPRVTQAADARSIQRPRRMAAPLRAADALVYGERVGQALPLVRAATPECGFVALSHVLDRGGKPTGSMWLMPAARCVRADDKHPLAQHFPGWLRTHSAATQTIRAAGNALSKRYKDLAQRRRNMAAKGSGPQRARTRKRLLALCARPPAVTFHA
jgi:hypothetical protein